MTELLDIPLGPGRDFWCPHEDEARWQYEEIFTAGCYDSIRLPRDAFVVDVGANIGLFTYFLKLKCPSARVLAVEPMPDVLLALRRNVERLGLLGVSIEECAVGGRHEDSVPFVYYPLAPGNSTRYPEEKELQISVLSGVARRSGMALPAGQGPEDYVRSQYTGRRVDVPVERLSSLLVTGERVDLVKIDVEGAELEVLRGVDADHWPLIDQVVLEVQDLDGRLAAIGDLLRRHGYEVDVRPSPMIPEDIRTFLVHAVRLRPPGG